MAVFHRPYDALIAAVPVLVYAVVSSGRSRDLARVAGFTALGAAPSLVLLALYNTAVMGAPWRLPFEVSGPIDRFGFGNRATFVVPGVTEGAHIDYTPAEAARATWESLLAFPRFMLAAPLVLALAGYAVARKWRDRRLWLLVAMIATVIVAYYFWWGVANAIQFDLYDALGPFYHYILLVPLAVLAAWGLTTLRPRPALAGGLIVLALAWAIPVTTNVLKDAQEDGRARSAEWALLDAPGRSLVLEDPLFPRDPYVRVANDADLDGPRVVGIDIPGARLDAIEQFPDRAAYLVRSQHAAGDPFGPTSRDRVPMAVVEGETVSISSTANAAQDSLTSYLRIGDTVEEVAGPSATWLLDPGRLTSASETVAVGYLVAPDDFVECRFEARGGAAGVVSILTPCAGYVGYAFPDGKKAVVAEDVSGRLTVSVR